MKLIEYSLTASRQTLIGRWILQSDGKTVAAFAELVPHLETPHFKEVILPQYVQAGIATADILVYNPNNKKGAKRPPAPRLLLVEADAIAAGIDVSALEVALANFKGKSAAEKLQAANRAGYVVVADKPESVKSKKVKPK
jgi:hypothetical protein